MFSPNLISNSYIFLSYLTYTSWKVIQNEIIFDFCLRLPHIVHTMHVHLYNVRMVNKCLAVTVSAVHIRNWRKMTVTATSMRSGPTPMHSRDSSVDSLTLAGDPNSVHVLSAGAAVMECALVALLIRVLWAFQVLTHLCLLVCTFLLFLYGIAVAANYLLLLYSITCHVQQMFHWVAETLVVFPGLYLLWQLLACGLWGKISLYNCGFSLDNYFNNATNTALVASGNSSMRSDNLHSLQSQDKHTLYIVYVQQSHSQATTILSYFSFTLGESLGTRLTIQLYPQHSHSLTFNHCMPWRDRNLVMYITHG